MRTIESEILSISVEGTVHLKKKKNWNSLYYCKQTKFTKSF